MSYAELLFALLFACLLVQLTDSWLIKVLLNSVFNVSAMLGLLAKQRKMKTLAASELSLPDVSNRHRQTEIETQTDRQRQKD